MKEDHQTIESNQAVHSNSKVKQYLITEEKFQLLRQCQQAIFKETELSPSIRKIINELITEDNLQKIRTKFQEFGNINHF